MFLFTSSRVSASVSFLILSLLNNLFVRLKNFTLGLVLTTSLLSSCAKQNPAPIPSPLSSGVVSRSSFFHIATNIHRPGDFAPFEPILRELTNSDPVPFSKIVFAPTASIHTTCGIHAGGCYRSSDQRIFISFDSFDQGVGRPPSNSYLCGITGNSDFSISSRSRFETYLHEQGHHFDLHQSTSPSGQWIDQLEAEAFVFFVAEHIAKRYDLDLGLGILEHKSEIPLIRPSFTSAQIIAQTASESFNPWNADLCATGIFTLLGSGFESFADLWFFVHTNSEETVARRIRSNVGNYSNSRLVYSNILSTLYRSYRSFDISSFNFGIEPFPPLHPPYLDLPDSVRTGFARATLIYRSPESTSWSFSFFNSNSSSIRFDITKRPTSYSLSITDDLNGSILLIPQAESNVGYLVVFDNPRSISSCARSISRVSMDPNFYLNLLRRNLFLLTIFLEEKSLLASANWLRRQLPEIFSP